MLISQSFNVLSCDCPLCPYSPQCQDYTESTPCSLCRDPDCDACDGLSYSLEELTTGFSRCVTQKTTYQNESGISCEIDLFNSIDLPYVVYQFRAMFENLKICNARKPKEDWSAIKVYSFEFRPPFVCDTHKNQCRFNEKQRWPNSKSKCVSVEGEHLRVTIPFKVSLSENKKGLHVKMESCTCAKSKRQFKFTFKNGLSEIEIPFNPRTLMIRLFSAEGPQKPEEHSTDCASVLDQEGAALISRQPLAESDDISHKQQMP